MGLYPLKPQNPQVNQYQIVEPTAFYTSLHKSASLGIKQLKIIFLDKILPLGDFVLTLSI